MNLAIIGCGLIGHKRLAAFQHKHRLVATADLVFERAQALAAKSPGAVALGDWRAVMDRADVDAVIVSTTNEWLAGITLAAAQAGKHVIVEKPAARNLPELEEVISAAEQAGVQVQVGLNHRYHPALQKARELVDAGAIGPLMFLRGRYGHGGRVGYDREWRADPRIAGGGELIDQGIHLIDLSRWFLGEFPSVQGYAHTYFWNMAVDDNAFLQLRTAQQQVAWLHVSCTEWKNLFSLEIYGRDGKLDISGLGGSYGVERLAYYKMLPEMGPPETTIWEYPGQDRSWSLEFDAFTQSIEQRVSRGPNLYDAKAALQIIEQIYQLSSP